jgi:beta-phosphoglucomutase family hydrolase
MAASSEPGAIEAVDLVTFWSAYTAALFDLDGVLTPTAELHQRAWAEMFEGFLTERLGPDHEPYTTADYHAYVDGRPRFDGVRAFLASRDIALPEGDADDPPGHGSVGALGNRKNALFNELLTTQGITPYPGSVRLLDHLARVGVQVAVVSSSRNAGRVLSAARLADRFDVVVDGVSADAGDIAGKPAPDMFLAACAGLGAAPASAVVVEDAVSGVAAGAAGGFGLVIGVDRGAGRAALTAAGAQLVVHDLAELVPGDAGAPA